MAPALAWQRDAVGIGTVPRRIIAVLSRVASHRRLLLRHDVRQLVQRQAIVSHYGNRTVAEADADDGATITTPLVLTHYDIWFISRSSVICKLLFSINAVLTQVSRKPKYDYLMKSTVLSKYS